jgi:hypothetical protein
MSQLYMLKAAGLYTSPNALSEAPEGALSVADNIVISQDGVIEPRRGYEADGTPSAAIKSLTAFDGKRIAHVGSTIAYGSGGTWTALSGSYTAPTGAPVRFAQAQKSLYFTTNAGIRRADGHDITPAVPGAFNALEPGLAASTTAPTWLADGYSVAYRIAWGIKDAHGRIMLGPPSGRVVVANSAGATRSVTVSAHIPPGVTSSHFLQVYRSTQTTGTPSDEMGLVYEATPTAADVTAKALTFVDVVPDSMRGATGYFCPSQEGMLQANYRPPLALDLALHKRTMVYANATSKHRLPLALLAVDTTKLAIATTIYFQTSDGALLSTVSARAAEELTLARFELYSAGSASENVRRTSESFARALTLRPNTAHFGYYTSTEDEAPGKLLVEEIGIGTDQFHAWVLRASGSTPGAGQLFSPPLPEGTSITQLQRASDVVTATTAGATAHGYAVGQVVELYRFVAADANFPAGLKTIASVPSASTFTYAEAGSDALLSPSTNYVALNQTKELVLSDNERSPARLYFSKEDQPDAVPLLNYTDVGSKTAAVLRIAPLRDSLFIFKEDGLYRMTGEDASDFRVQLFDPTVKLLAPGSVAAMGNQLYALTTQGVVAISDGGVRTVSRPIESTLLSRATPAMLSALSAATVGMGYDSERLYVLWLPTTAGDTAAREAYVYNAATGTWTRWDFGVSAAVLDPSDDRLYFGGASAGAGATAAYKERKARTDADYLDGASAISAAVTWLPSVAGAPGAMKHWREMQLFQQGGSAVSLTLSAQTDLAASASTVAVTPSAGQAVIRAPVPLEQRRGSHFTLGLTASLSEKKLVLRGAGLLFSPAGERARK